MVPDLATQPPTLHLMEDWWHRFGPIRLTEDEIVNMARLVDPQPIHTDRAHAQTTRFGGIIASGIHPYLEFHKRFWVPLVADNFIAGMSIDGVVFFHPVFPNQPLWGVLRILAVNPKPDKGTAAVQWQWHIQDADDRLLQEIRYTAYHLMPRP